MKIEVDKKDYSPPNFNFKLNTVHPFRKFVRRWLNQFRHPFYHFKYRHHLPKTRSDFKVARVLSNVGIPIEQERKKILNLIHGAVKKILIVGCGDGAAMGEWLRLKPSQIIAIDLFRFDKAWNKAKEVATTKGCSLRFIQGDIAHLKEVIEDNWADVIVSEAVFEHCRNLNQVLPELKRMLRHGGILYASYGPLWYAAGGDHFSSRGGLQHVYNHLLQSSEEYANYFKSHLREDEPTQEGGRYVPLDLFSKLTPRDYLKLYQENGFSIEELDVEISSDGVHFRDSYPEKWNELINKYPHLWEEEFLTKGHWIWLRKGV